MGRGVVPEIGVDLLAYQDDAAEADYSVRGVVQWLCADALVYL